METVPCLICGSDRRRTLSLGISRPLSRCARCGLVAWASPPDPSERRNLYETTYQTLPLESPEAIARRLRLFEHYLEILERRTSGRRLLDVGCGQGHFLEAAQARGWDALGVELYAGAAAAGDARGVRIIEGGDAAIDALDAGFNVVTLWNVLDQMPEPAQALPRVYRSLAPGGWVVVRVPNVQFHLAACRGWRSLRRGRPYPGVFHPLGFASGTLRTFLQQAGFEDVSVDNSFLTDVASPPVRWVLSSGAGLVASASGGRWLWGPSLVAFARRPAGNHHR